MKLRTQVGLAFFLLAVLPLAGIVLYSYFSSLQAFRRAVETETQSLTDELGGRMTTARGDMDRLVEDLGTLPLPVLLSERTRPSSSSELGSIYTRLVEGIGEAATLVEWFEFSPLALAEETLGSHASAPAEGLIIFPSDALANALRKLERYRELDPTASDEILATMQTTLEAAMKRRSLLPEPEREALDASAERSRRLLGTEFQSPVTVEDELVGYLRVQVRPEPMLRRVLSRTERRESEIPFALDAEGNLHVADPLDNERLDGFRVTGVEAGRPSLEAGDSRDWIVVEDHDQSGLVFGIARPIGTSLQGMQQTAARNFVAGLAISGLALVGVMLLSTRLTRRVGILTSGAERLALGDLQVRVPEGSNDELGQLARTFNRMAYELSEKEQRLLEEERMRKEQEIEQRLLEAENNRKGVELEEARHFQVSLLPRSIPRLAGLDIDVHMQTATEVGGDFYDFFTPQPGELIVAIGDATGHGTRAGTMASVVKGMLSLGIEDDLPTFLERANRAVCRMQLERMAMSLTLVRIEGDQISIAAAGMPPALLFRNASGTVEEVPLEGVPLGGLSHYNYESWQGSLDRGDTLLLMTDGLPELADSRQELFGYPRVMSLFEQIGSRSNEEILKALTATVSEWSDGARPEDDITFVVIQAGC